MDDWDLILWVLCGLGALLELYIWTLLMDRFGPYGPPARPSEIAGTCFFVMLFGPAAFVFISMASVVGLVLRPPLSRPAGCWTKSLTAEDIRSNERNQNKCKT